MGFLYIFLVFCSNSKACQHRHKGQVFFISISIKYIDLKAFTGDNKNSTKPNIQ